MGLEDRRLPFDFPVPGCRIDHIHHLGPFVTRVDYRLPDGSPRTWRSRAHRTIAGLSVEPEAARPGEAPPLRWWLEVWALVKVFWWVASLFMVGSLCFAVASGSGLDPDPSGAFPPSPTVLNAVFFAGSIFFSVAAYLQWLVAINAKRIAAIAHRVELSGRMRWFAWRPREIGWLSAFSQFVGTLLFNANTADALLPGLDWLQEDLLVWAPDLVGSACFLVASALAAVEYAHAEGALRPRDVSWWVVAVNLAGSVAFGISSVFALPLRSGAEVWDAWAVDAFTLAGALCFLLGAYLLIPELARNLRRVVADRPRA